MGEIIKIIEKETDGKSFNSHKYWYDDANRSNIEYDTSVNVVWEKYGETEKHKQPVGLRKRAEMAASAGTIFKYFLDGSRRIFKVDDISYNNNVFPILAGQTGICCCKRVNKELSSELIKLKTVIALPDIAYRDGWNSDMFFEELRDKINKNGRLKQLFGIEIDKILIYKRDQDDNYEKKGIAVIQDFMVEQEKEAVADMTSANKLGQKEFLIKDGSIEYQYNRKNKLNIKVNRVKNNYRYVVGVSKSFDPTKCFVKGGGTNSDIIANLKLYERTPVYMYQSQRAGDVFFAIWYLRLRDVRYTHNVFDGVLKIEKLITSTEEQERGIDSEVVDIISANLINERNPVCYGIDSRWANHIYPIYLTEKFIKSKYLSNNLFLQLF